MSSHPFRSTAEMVADGTIRRPGYLDMDSPFIEPGGVATATRRFALVPRAQASNVCTATSVAVAGGEESAAQPKERLRHPDRIGRLMH
jgi:hypothetical protein